MPIERAEIKPPLGAAPIEREPQRHGWCHLPVALNGVTIVLSDESIILKAKILGARLFHRVWPATLIFLGLVLSGAWIALLGYALIAAASDLV